MIYDRGFVVSDHVISVSDQCGICRGLFNGSTEFDESSLCMSNVIW